MVRMVRLELTRLRQMILSHSWLPITPHPLKSGTRSGSRTHTPKRQSLNLMRLPIPPFEYRKVVPPPASVSTRGSRYSDTKIFPPIGTWPCPSNGHVASINWRKYYMKPLVSLATPKWALQFCGAKLKAIRSKLHPSIKPKPTFRM